MFRLESLELSGTLSLVLCGHILLVTSCSPVELRPLVSCADVNYRKQNSAYKRNNKNIKNTRATDGNFTATEVYVHLYTSPKHLYTARKHLGTDVDENHHRKQNLQVQIFIAVYNDNWQPHRNAMVAVPERAA